MSAMLPSAAGVVLLTALSFTCDLAQLAWNVLRPLKAPQRGRKGLHKQ